MNKIILVGVDSSSWEIIDPFIKEGFLPNFKKLKNDGLSSILTSAYPPVSPPGWVSMFTGTEPVRHRIIDFVKRKKGSYFIEPIFSSDRKEPFIWEFISEKSKRTIAIAIPFAYPTRPFNGIITTGLGTPSKKSEFTYPKEVKDHILKNYPDFDVDFEENNISFQMDFSKMIKKVNDATYHQFLFGKELFYKEKWDLFIFVFRSTDVIQHYLINDKELLLKTYQQVDDYLGWFIEHMDKDTTLLLASDHGGSQVHTRFYINNWLYDNGYLSVNPKKNKISLVDMDKLESLLINSPLKDTVWKLKRTGIAETLLKVSKHFIISRRFGEYQNVNWNKSTLYSLATSAGLIFVNQKDREPNGVVDYVDRYNLLKEFKNKILKLLYNGKKVVDKVILIDDIYPQRNLNDIDLPDAILILNKGFTMNPGLTLGEIFETERIRIGDHNMDGIISIYSKNKDYSKMKKKKSYAIYDIVPTCLKIMNIKVPLKFDGESIV